MTNRSRSPGHRSTRSRSGSRSARATPLIGEVRRQVEQPCTPTGRWPRSWRSGRCRPCPSRRRRRRRESSRGARRCSPPSTGGRLWDRIFRVDSAFASALFATIYIAVIAQVLGVVLGLVAALMRMSRLRLLQVLSGFYVLGLPRHAGDRADLLRLLRREPPVRRHADPELARLRAVHAGRGRVRRASWRSGSTRARTCARSSAPASTRSTRARWRRRGRSG